MKFSSSALMLSCLAFAACAADAIDGEAIEDGEDAWGIDGGFVREDSPDAASHRTVAGDGGKGSSVPDARGRGGAPGDAGSRGDAGTAPPDAARAAADAGPTPAVGRVAITAAGYAGRRITSFDDGATWVGDQRLGGGGDDQFLLRDVAFGAGRVVAVGWKFFSSTDGTQWTEHKNPHGQWQGGVAWGNGMFLAAGGLGRAARSTDGVTWQTAANAGSSHIRRVVFADGSFWATGDSGTVYRTQDGRTWITGGSFPAVAEKEGSLIVRKGGDGVQVSTDGTTWNTVLKTGGLEGVSIGRLP